MKKITLLFAAIFTIVSTTFSQQDATATKILDGVTAKYKTYTSVKAAFSLKVEDGQNKVTDQQTGTFYLKGTKFRIEMTNQIISCNATTIWTYLKKSNEVTIADYEPDPDEITPDKIFTIYQKDFIYQYMGESTVAGVVYQKIDLSPVDKSKPFFKVSLTIDKVNKTISSAKVFDKNGNKYTYTIPSITPNITLTDAFFNFDATKYPGIKTTDLR